MFIAALRHFWMLFQYCWVLSSQLEKCSSNIQLKHQCLPMDLWMTITLYVTSLQVPTWWGPGALLTHLRLCLLPPPTHSHSKLSPASELFCFLCRFFGSSWLALHLSTLFSVISSERFFPLSSLKYASIHPHPSTLLWYSQVPLGLLSLPYLSWIVHTLLAGIHLFIYL